MCGTLRRKETSRSSSQHSAHRLISEYLSDSQILAMIATHQYTCPDIAHPEARTALHDSSHLAERRSAPGLLSFIWQYFVMLSCLKKGLR